ncbi:MAG: Flp family type IVb pilin [Candidatus Eremiobacteraeota bacterium]|jgi:Flp pilus assembly pilin Flp|nr:Flp family type IVb pilin [Candidatus Eremiobacteraeota bacterium]
MLRNDDGATLVEYSLVVALIAGVAIVIIGKLGASINTLFGTVKTNVDSANGGVGQ